MPGLVSSYPQGAAWKTSAIGQKFSAFLADKGVVILSWIWQAGGVASRGNPIVQPEDAKGQKIRGGSREMDERVPPGNWCEIFSVTAAEAEFSRPAASRTGAAIADLRAERRLSISSVMSSLRGFVGRDHERIRP
jgi:hypothetical protein